MKRVALPKPDKSPSRNRHLSTLDASILTAFENTPGILRKRIIESDYASEEAFLQLQAEIANNMAEGVLVVRASDGVIRFTNQRFEQMFGYDEGELVGKHVSVLNAPGDQSPQEIAREIIKTLNETSVWRGEINNIKKDGTSFWCQTSVSTLEHFQLGKIWVGIHEDINSRKKAEEELRKFKTISDGAGYGIATITPDGNLVYVNESFAAMHGYTVEELNDKNISVTYTIFTGD